MIRNLPFVLLLATGLALADDAAEKKRVPNATEAQEKAKEEQSQSKEEQSRTKESPDLGMSILGNQEAPKSLVIVPWKSSEIGDSLGISTLLDDSRQPIDKEVFMRALSYYELRSETTTGATQPGTAAHRRKP